MSAYNMWEWACLAMGGFTPLCHRREKPRIEIGHEVSIDLPFGRLIRFECATPRPKLLVVAPMSGHHASLMMDIVIRLRDAFDVYLTDWTCASQVPLQAGGLGLDDNVEYIKTFLRWVNGTHVVCVSQSCVSTLAAIALMAAQGEALPKSLTLLGGPIDIEKGATRISTTVANTPISWFEGRVTEISRSWAGWGQQVWPAFAQHAFFLGHRPMEKEQFDTRAQYESFYDEYHSVMDLPAKYFLEVIKCVFHDRALASGTMVVNGQTVDLGLISNMALLTVEGQFDNTVGLGQTRAALELCTGIPDRAKKNIVVPTNHYSMICGSLWHRLVAEEVMSFMREHE